LETAPDATVSEVAAGEAATPEAVSWKIEASEPAASEAATWEATAIEPTAGDTVAGASDLGETAADVQTASEAAAGVASGNYATHETFEEMLEKSIKTLHTGDKVSGIVTSITGTEISLDLGTKQSGYIPVSEFTDEAGASIEDVIKIGDVIESYVMRVNDVEGTVMLSKKRLDAVKNWGDIEAAKNNRTVVEGVVTEENRGGIVVNVRGVRVFVPASQSGVPKTASMTDMLKKTVKLRITEVNPSKRRVVGSIRDARDAERREKALQVWADIEKGKQYTGTVKSMTSYGVFVDIGGVDGMIHVSELSWNRVRQPSEVVAIGDEIVVSVKDFDKEKKKISLTCKKPEDNPWENFASKYAVGDIVSVKIVKMMPFGAFAEICPGVDGLIHISQITDHRIGQPSEVLSDGQVVDVKITEIDMGKGKVSLSIRALMDPSSQPVSDKEAAEAAEADKTPVVVYDTDAPPEDDEADDAGESEAAPEEKDEDE
jgi:4-hydroxy-3-methylbut-2-enyl diphosphate reductase